MNAFALKVNRWFWDRYCYTMVVISFTILKSIPLVHDFVEPLFKFVLLWGLALIAKDLLVERQIFKTTPGIIAFAFVVFMGISALVNFRYGFILNVKVGLYNSTALLITFIFNFPKSKEDTESFIYRVNSIIIYGTFLLGCIALLMFITWYRSSIVYYGRTLDIGVTTDRLTGVYSDPVMAALISGISILLCLVNGWIRTKNFFKLPRFYMINIIVQFVVLAATDSNGVFAALAVVTGMCVILFVSPLLYRKCNNILKTVIVTAIAVCVVSQGTYLTVDLCKKVIGTVPSIILYAKNSAPNYFPFGDEEDIPKDKPVFEMKRVGQQYSELYEQGQLGQTIDITSGRLYLWRASFAYGMQHPVFGIGGKISDDENGNLINQVDMNKIDPAYVARLIRMNGSTHNIFLQVFMVYGFIGLALFLLLLSYIAIPAFKKLPTLKYGANDYVLLAFSILICAFIGAENMVENYILCRTLDVPMYIFWLYAGYIVYFCAKPKAMDRLEQDCQSKS